MINSVPVYTLTPEIFDWEVAPTVMRLTADTAAVDAGDSVTITMDTNAGINVGDISIISKKTPRAVLPQ